MARRNFTELFLWDLWTCQTPVLRLCSTRPSEWNSYYVWPTYYKFPKMKLFGGFSSSLSATLMPLFFRQIKYRFGRTDPTFQWDHWSFRVPKGVLSQKQCQHLLLSSPMVTGKGGFLYPWRRRNSQVSCVDFMRINRTWTTHKTHAQKNSVEATRHQKKHLLTSPNWTQNRSDFFFTTTFS